MKRARSEEKTRFHALRACWVILRGGSVAYLVNFTDGGADFLSRNSYIYGCEIDGQPVTMWDLHLSEPERQPP
jgi:hypothetical protein